MKDSRATKRLWLTVIVASWVTGPTAAARDDGQGALLAGYMEEMAAQYDFSGSVLVRQSGKPVLARGYGLADAEWQIPNTPATRFRIGSVTKQFTAMGILILVQQGKLKLSDRVADFIPRSFEGWSDIRVDNLLNHSSGILHSWKIPNFRERVMVPFSIDEMLDSVEGSPLLFAPGTGFEYSGIGYFLLARIIEQVSGKPYEDFMRDSIFDPLGMADTGFDSHSAVIPNRASGYVRVNGELRNAPYIHMPNLMGGGNLYSTVEDLAKWDQALNDRKFISERLYREMYTPGKENYGFGWYILQKSGYTVIEHHGGVNGFHALIRRIPDKQTSIIVLTNQHTSDNWKRVADGLEAILLKRQ